MSWIVVGVAAAGAVMGQMNAQQQRDQKKKEMVANAEAMRMSPWTGMKTEMQGMGGTPTGAMGAMQGGMTGAMMGSQFGKATAAKPDAGGPGTGFDGKAMTGDPSMGGQQPMTPQQLELKRQENELLGKKNPNLYTA